MVLHFKDFGLTLSEMGHHWRVSSEMGLEQRSEMLWSIFSKEQSGCCSGNR